MARTIGRPRTHASTTGRGTQQDILAAAARVFTEVGYGGASTHRIAREARISQPTLYHYYDGKAALLLDLLMATVRPSLTFAEGQRGGDSPAEVQLAALCAYDVTLLLSGEHNLGSLYLLQELAEEQFAPFRAERTALYRCYRSLVAAVLGTDEASAHGRASLVFGLVESVILRRRTEPALDDATVAREVADAALAILGLDAAARNPVVRAGLAQAGAAPRPDGDAGGGGADGG